MTVNKSDLRVQRTRRSIREAMIDLILNNPYEEITVRNIAKHAGVGFKTFYRHYRDKSDLMRDIQEEFLVKAQAEILPPTNLSSGEKQTLPILHFGQKHADLLRAILRTPINDQWTERLIQFGFLYAQQIELESHDENPSKDEKIRDLAIHQLIHGTIILLGWWLENDMPFEAEEMAEYMNHVLVRPVWGLPKVKISD